MGLQQVFSELYGPGVVMFLFAAASFLAGMGYRRLAAALVVSVSVALVAATAGAFLTLILLAPFVGRGEGAGIAMFLLSVFGGGVCGAAALIAALGYVIVRRRRFLERGKTAWWFHLIGAVLVLFSGMSVASRFPALRSDTSLARQLDVGGSSLYGQEAEEELRRRGRDAVPALIAAINRADEAALKEFESGRTQGVQQELRLLGEIGGPEAIAELRRWLHRDIAPDVRAAAAGGLGLAGDTESAHAIALLLENRSYDTKRSRSWRSSTRRNPGSLFATSAQAAAKPAATRLTASSRNKA